MERRLPRGRQTPQNDLAREKQTESRPWRNEARSKEEVEEKESEERRRRR